MAISWFGGVDGVLLTVEAALSAATGSYGAWDAGKWDTATWGPDVTWTDISSYVRGLRSDRAFGRELSSWDPGTATVELSNRDGRFSPDNLTGPYVTAGVTGVRPWRPIRWRATYGGVTYPVYTGYALDWQEAWAEGHSDAEVHVPCVDELAALAAYDGLEQAPVGAGELSGRRVHRILNNAGHTGARAVEAGQVTMQATTLAQNAITELKLTEDSEGGGLFVDADGTLVFEQQYALMENARSNTVQASFGDGSGSELPCADVTPVYGGDRLANAVAFARTGGTAQTAQDLTSQSLYGPKRYGRSDLVCETDAQALALATFYLEQHKAPFKRFSRIQVKPRRDPARLFPQVLGRRVRDLIQVTARPLGGVTTTRFCHIAGIHHTVTGDDWTTEFDLWDATVYRTYSNSRWDAAKWDTAAWFF